MAYHILDLNGRIVQTMPLTYSHHNVIWDIIDLPAGTYILSMMQGTKVKGRKEQLVVK